MSLLLVERGAGAGSRIALTKFPITVGRDPANDVHVDDEEVSRFHLRIKRRGRLHIAEDLESRNGTFINGDRILNSIVQNGDKILIGATEFQFVASEPGIHLAGELIDFNMIVDKDLGLKGPIEVGEPPLHPSFDPVRIDQSQVINQRVDDIKIVREIYEVQGHLVVSTTLEDAAKTLLKGIGTLMPSASRGAVFAWAAPNRQLIPIASRSYTRKQKHPLLLSQRSLEDVLARRQGIILQPRSPQITQGGRTRIILPMLHNDEPIAVIHLEADTPSSSFADRDMAFVQALIGRAAPTFETMMLRREIDAWMVGMIETLIATIEAKDTYTQGHSERVSRYSMAIADELRLNREVKKLLLVSALTHDIGKIGIPDAILKKASLLSAEEYEEMKLHPTIGADIVNHLPNAHRIISGVKHHHEKWDGTGYPDGLAGEEIPFFGRIVAVADVFDAMISGRAYSGFMDESNAIERIIAERDLFDPEILKAMIRAHENGTLTLKTGTGNQNPVPRKVKDPRPPEATQEATKLNDSDISFRKKNG